MTSEAETDADLLEAAALLYDDSVVTEVWLLDIPLAEKVRMGLAAPAFQDLPASVRDYWLGRARSDAAREALFAEPASGGRPDVRSVLSDSCTYPMCGCVFECALPKPMGYDPDRGYLPGSVADKLASLDPGLPEPVLAEDVGCSCLFCRERAAEAAQQEPAQDLIDSILSELRERVYASGLADFGYDYGEDDDILDDGDILDEVIDGCTCDFCVGSLGTLPLAAEQFPGFEYYGEDEVEPHADGSFDPATTVSHFCDWPYCACPEVEGGAVCQGLPRRGAEIPPASASEPPSEEYVQPRAEDITAAMDGLKALFGPLSSLTLVYRIDDEFKTEGIATDDGDLPEAIAALARMHARLTAQAAVDDFIEMLEDAVESTGE